MQQRGPSIYLQLTGGHVSGGQGGIALKLFNHLCVVTKTVVIDKKGQLHNAALCKPAFVYCVRAELAATAFYQSHDFVGPPTASADPATVEIIF